MLYTKFKPIKMIGQEKGVLDYLRMLMYKISSALEVLILILLWLAIFSNKSVFKGFTIEEMVTYIIAGSLIGLISRYFIHRIISHDLFSSDSESLVYKPIKYFFHILIKGFGRNILPFIVAVTLHLLILYFFLDSFVINLEATYLAVIMLMVLLAFITEFLMAYLANLFIFWKFESSEFYTILARLKKILAGNYFPLSLLPAIFVNISLALPFAYLFFVPTQLYLKKIDIASGLRGVGVQILWIILLYICVKLVWRAKFKKKEKVKVIKTFR